MFAISVFIRAVVTGEAIRIGGEEEGGGYGLSTLDAGNALKIFVMCSFCPCCFGTFRFGSGSLLLRRRRVHTCVCFIATVNVYINLDEQIESVHCG